MDQNTNKLSFSAQKQEDGRYRVIAKSGHYMTYLVCECESSELALYLVGEFNQQHEESKRMIVRSVCANPDAGYDTQRFLQMA